MKLYSIPDDDKPIIEALLEIKRTPYPARNNHIKALENLGYTVKRLPDGGYHAQSDNKEYRLPRIICPHCKRTRNFDEFVTSRNIEHPWCVNCRRTNHEEAERARAKRDDIWARGEVPVRENMCCRNPVCPNGGRLTRRQVQTKQKFAA